MTHYSYAVNSKQPSTASADAHPCAVPAERAALAPATRAPRPRMRHARASDAKFSAIAAVSLQINCVFSPQLVMTICLHALHITSII
jgi:hypothetical protein